jgi:Na+-translocating ferredoxin:NAD+ oxidoreductase RnfD subunit
MSFFRTPKGLLLGVLAVLAAVSAPVAGLRLVMPGIVASMVSASIVDAVLLRWRTGRWQVPSGAMLTALIVAMVLSPHEPWPIVVVTAVLGVVSKYVIRARLANVFNPAALALVATFYLFHTGQSWWGALPELPWPFIGLLLGAGIFISDRVNKLPLVLAFLGVYYLLFTGAAYAGFADRVQAIFRAPDLHASLYFAFFILTDPPTSPTRHGEQVLAGALVALASFVVFASAGAVHYLLSGVLVGNVWEAWRRTRTATSSRARRPAAPALRRGL